MDRLVEAYGSAKEKYDNSSEPLREIEQTVLEALRLLKGESSREFGKIGDKRYYVFEAGETRSRPFLRNLLLSPTTFSRKWRRFLESASKEHAKFLVDELSATQVVYTAIMSFALCYDLWKPRSRKTPGTFFEVVLGSLLHLLVPRATRKKFIGLREALVVVDQPQAELVTREEADRAGASDTNVEDISASSVSTDIVFELNTPHGLRGIVIPAKITTRERIVQPFAHQRILDSAFGVGRYISLLACVSETQRDDRNNRVNEICVPGTIDLFQRYLAKLNGLYYLDPPERYLRLSQQGGLMVRSVGELMVKDFSEVVKQLQTSPIG